MDDILCCLGLNFLRGLLEAVVSVVTAPLVLFMPHTAEPWT